MQTTRIVAVVLVSFFVSAAADSLTAQTITHVPLYTFHGDSAGDWFGHWASGAGDLNGDGRDDLVVGAFRDDNNGIDSGSVRIFSGSDGSVLLNVNGDSAGDGFGRSVNSAGDVNGDGTPDLIVGVWEDDNDSGVDAGSARVLSGIDGSVLYNFDGDSAGDRFGFSVSGAGDVNGDGRADLIVGVPTGDNDSGVDAGSAHVFSGSDGSVLYNFYGDSSGDDLGRSVSGVGDVNGDGTPDLIVGVHGDDNNGSGSGSVRVLSGSDGSVLYDFDGDNAGDGFGVPVSGAGDVNGDGTPDLIVGAWKDDNNGNSSGSARVFSGIDGSVLYDFDGDDAGDEFGRSVSGAGDVNGDGFADLIVGAWFANDSGSARVLSGSDGSVLYNFDGDNAGDTFGVSVRGAGDVNGDGIDDLIVGARHGGDNDGGYVRVFVSQISEPELLLGDCNLDGNVNFLDIGPFIAILSTADYLAEADINEDSVVDFLDIQHFIAILSS